LLDSLLQEIWIFWTKMLTLKKVNSQKIVVLKMKKREYLCQ